MAVTAGNGRDGRRSPLRRLGLAAVCVLAVVLLAVGVPLVEQARWKQACAERGGRLVSSTEAVEPLVTARDVFTCYGPGGSILYRG
jgi:hypothetical protein